MALRRLFPMAVLALVVVTTALSVAAVVFWGPGDAVAQGAVIPVTSTVDGSDVNLLDGVCNDGSGNCTLRAAIEQAASGDTIDIPAGVYTLAFGELNIDKSLTLTGAGSRDTIIQASTVNPVLFPADPGVAGHRVLSINGGSNVAISDVTIRHGNSGGGAGGGIAIHFGDTLTLTSSTVSDNATGGGAGGGIVNNFGDLTLTSSTVSGNTDSGGGGSGIYNTGTLLGTVSTVILTNSTVSGNSHEGIGSEGALTLTNSTVSGNSGRGISNYGGTANLENTILAGNGATGSGPDCGGSPTSLGHNLIGNDTGCAFTPTAGDLVGDGAGPIDALLGPLANNGGPTFTHALLPGSPAIDSGDDSVLGAPHDLATDQRGAGFPRLQGIHVDIGAYEAAPGVRFSSPVTWNAMGNGQVMIADIDNDGDNDLVIPGQSPDFMYVYHNSGDGTFGQLTSYGLGPGPHPGSVADFNGDGYLDVAVAVVNIGSVTVFINQQDGSFASGINYSAGSSPYSTAVGKIDGDEHTDIVVPNFESDSISVLINNGDGTFTLTATFVTPDRPQHILAADLDGDGDPDVVTLHSFDDLIAVFINDGNGGFAPAVTYSVGDAPDAFFVGDLSGDARPELVTANKLGDSITVLTNNGNGVFVSPSEYTIEGRPAAVAMGDLDADGDQDVVVGSQSSKTIVALLNNGVGLLSSPATISAGLEDNPGYIALAARPRNTVGECLGV